jgi:hypothetical protein
MDYTNKTPFPHVDDFAAARNAALDMTTGDVITWADFDDVITEETANDIRLCSDDMISGKIEYTRQEGSPEPHSENGLLAIHVFAKYDLATQGESAMRERLFTRSCHPRWRGALHENLLQTKPSIRITAPFVWIHRPLENHSKEPMRNLRILRAATDLSDHYAFERGRQEYIEWNQSAEKPDELSGNARRWLGMALADPRCLPPRKYQGLVMLAAMDRKEDPERAKDLLWQAIRLCPEVRDAYALLAEIELASGRATRALCVWSAAVAQRKPADCGFQITEKLYRWNAADLICRCRRACGDDPQPELDKAAAVKGGYKIALLHATRGRAGQAMVTRQSWHEAAHDASRILHIFASDIDDPDTAKLEAQGALVLRNEGKSCVSAWNLAAEHAANLEIPILIQLSDDWIPCMDWDFFVTQSLKDASKKKLGKDPLVLRISDGNGNKDLMCMAIITLQRYRDQGHLFAPEYFGVFSDNEFSHRAKQDGVIVDGSHIHFRHLHPFHGTAIVDDTYKRQNDEKRYEEGLEIYNRRNPSK